MDVSDMGQSLRGGRRRDCQFAATSWCCYFVGIMWRRGGWLLSPNKKVLILLPYSLKFLAALPDCDEWPKAASRSMNISSENPPLGEILGAPRKGSHAQVIYIMSTYIHSFPSSIVSLIFASPFAGLSPKIVLPTLTSLLPH